MEFLEKLKQLHISRAYIKNGKIYVYLEGYALPDKKVKIVRSCKFVGQHNYGAGKRVFVDDDVVEGRHMLSVVVHECVESWLQHTFFPEETNAEAYPKIHPIAEKIEKSWHIGKWGIKSWLMYSRAVNKVWEKENKS